MRTIKLVLQYDGTRYAGWQRQTRRRAIAKGHRSPVTRHPSKTVQETVERALETALRRKVCLVASGRTDAGVHAAAQVAHFSTRGKVDTWRLKAALNGILPRDVRVADIRETSRSFHARFDTRTKTYAYVISLGAKKAAFELPWVTEVSYDLDLRAMRRGARVLVGRRDFKSFQGHDRAVRSSRTRVDAIQIRKTQDKTGLPFLSGRTFVLIEIKAVGFLRGMVRNIVGTLIDVGRGRLKAGSVQAILDGRDRRLAGPCAPARGLFLKDVSYE